MRLLTTDINELNNVYRELPISAEEMYDILKGGTLDSASWHATTSADTHLKINKVEPEDGPADKYARSLGGLPLTEQVFKLIKEALIKRKK